MPSSFMHVTCSDCVGAGRFVLHCMSPRGKGKGKLAPAHAMKACRVGGGYRYRSAESKGHALKLYGESRALTSHILSLGIRWN
jgi:hypothetical protein